ncbi:MAG TPA: pitrilysin family protein [Acidisarcina sp.]
MKGALNHGAVSTAARIAALAIAANASALFSQAPVTAPPGVEPWKAIVIPPLHAFHPVQPKRVELRNGIVIFLEEDHELPFISGDITIRGGERDVPPAKSGLIDLYQESWRNSGSATINGDKLDDLLEAKAAKVETGGDVDSTSVSWNCLKGDEDQVFGIAVDLLEHPAFEEGKLQLAKQQMAAAIVRRNDQASSIAGREAALLVYGKNNPYARTPELATVMSVGVGDLKQWHDQTVAANNIIISVDGDFDAAEMERKLRAAFESMPRGKAASAPTEDFAGPKPGLYLVNKPDINQSNVAILGLGTERNNPDYYALSVMNEIFGGGFGSRLFQNVRTKQGLAYAVGGSYGASYDHPGIFRVAAGTRSENTLKAAQEMLRQIGELKTQPFSDEELQSAKDQVLNSFIFEYDSREKVLDTRTRLEFYGYPEDFLEKYRAGVEKVTTADLQRVAKKYIDPSKLAVLIVGNESEFGGSLDALGMGKPQILDITIPMPPGMAPPPGGPGQ